jgi:hypothetical protein
MAATEYRAVTTNPAVSIIRIQDLFVFCRFIELFVTSLAL